MALIIQKKQPGSQSFNFSRWYQANKDKLAAKRAKRYREDPEYRAAALKRGRAQRKKKKPTDVSSFIFSVSFKAMAEKLGITIWVLREWRKKDYFPEPHHRDGQLWFKPEHHTLLYMLSVFFQTHGPRVTEAKKEKLSEVVALIYSNW